MTQFSPIAKSPKVQQQRNLTGNPRIVRDSAATLHSSVQQWNSVHLHGLAILKNITETKIDENYPDDLQRLCDDLSKDCAKLDEIVCDMRQTSSQLVAVTSLHKGANKLFNEWPVERFAQIAQLICKAYRDEAEAKRKILENVAHDHRDSWKMLHLSAWVYQTNIHDGVTMALESMLVETGHRQT